MKSEFAIPILQKLLERYRIEHMGTSGINRGKEIPALLQAIECLASSVIEREKEINRAVHMIRDIISGPDARDLKEVWEFLRDKIQFSEEEKQEIERRLGLPIPSSDSSSRSL